MPTIQSIDSGVVVREIETRIRARLIKHNYGGIEDALIAALSADLYGAVMRGIHERSELEEVADRLENMVLRCRRHNVGRRPSHANAGATHLTAEAGLMWLLFVHRPSRYEQFATLCRSYGMSMASVRFEEAWAMARWLSQIGLYHIDASSKYAPDPDAQVRNA